MVKTPSEGTDLAKLYECPIRCGEALQPIGQHKVSVLNPKRTDTWEG